MRLKYTLFFLLLVVSAHSQKLTGVWRGYFIQKGLDMGMGMGSIGGDKYKFEVQINLLANNAIEGVTYSYKNTSFYGKAAMQGVFMKKNNYIVIKELKMLELKIEDMSDPCLMTCNLDYAKSGNKEILSGDFTSLNIKTKKDCGDGFVYLEKVPESDFKKEDFLLKKKTTPESKKTTETALNKPKTVKPGAEDALVNKPTTNPTKKPLTNSTTKNKPTTNTPPPNNKTNAASKGTGTSSNRPNNTTKPKTVKPGAEDAIVKNTPKPTVEVLKKDSSVHPKPMAPTTLPATEIKPLPADLANRTNTLVQTLYVDEGDIVIDLYDNGQIDNDTVSIYHNGNPALLHGKLTTNPLTVKIKVDAAHPYHEIVMVADNLGEVPPNTSLMVVTAGKKTYQLFLTSDLQKNAKINIQYKPGENNSKKQGQSLID